LKLKPFHNEKEEEKGDSKGEDENMSHGSDMIRSVDCYLHADPVHYGVTVNHVLENIPQAAR
jgi:hypothetical protein